MSDGPSRCPYCGRMLVWRDRGVMHEFPQCKRFTRLLQSLPKPPATRVADLKADGSIEDLGPAEIDGTPKGKA